MDARSHDDFTSPGDLTGAFDCLVEADAAAPVVFAATGTTTRAEIDALARELESDGRWADWPAGHVVGIAAPNGAGFLAALLAVWRRSCTALLLDADMPAERRRVAVEALGAVGVVHCASSAPVASAEFGFAASRNAVPRGGAVPGRGAAPARHPDAAVIKLTSGSTGAPRGILVSPRAVAADTFAIEAAMGIGGGDRVVAAVPMSFSYGFGSLVVPALLAGRQLVVPEAGLPLGNLTAAREFAATVLPTVPAFLAALLKRADDWQLPRSLRLLLSAGAPLPAEVAARFHARFGQPVHVFYGASECGGITYDATGEAAKRGTVGTPVPGVNVAIDAESGLVEVRSPAVATRYLPGEPALSGGVFRTGDRAAWDAGELRLLGRQGALINIGGHKINPREVEQIIGALPGVDSVVVTSIPTSEPKTTTCCALVESEDASVSRQRVHDWCLEQLPAFKLPRRIRIVPQIPRNARGKIQLEAVQRLLER